MSKSLILSVSDGRHMPMSVLYTDFFEKHGMKYDIIRINRYEDREKNLVTKTKSGKIYEYNGLVPMGTKFYKKLRLFLRFRKYAIKIINREKYNYIVVWNENTAAVFSDFLSLKYKNRYCVNIRDFYRDLLYEKYLVNLANKNSDFIMEPTPGLVKGFPGKTFLCYNRDTRLLKQYTPHEFHGADSPIRITHLGFYSKTEIEAKQIADALGNDGRYELYFYGQGFEDKFLSYIQQKGYKNIFVGGAFPYEETVTYFNNTDIINAYYNEENHVELAFGIKNSYTPLLYIPGLTSTKTQWARESKEYGGLAYLINESNINTLADDLYKWYMSLDYKSFVEWCEKFNAKVFESQRKIENRLLKALDA